MVIVRFLGTKLPNSGSFVQYEPSHT